MKKNPEPKPKRKNLGGRPRIKIDWEQVDQMCHIQCTCEEICSVLGISADTLARACEREKNVGFAEYFKQKSEGGKSSLRRRGWLMAQENPALMIFHLKNHLGMADKTEISIPNQINIRLTE